MSQKIPRVSIGIPVYNGERYLSECLDCLRAQTFGDFEIIICDNASTDHTEQVGRSYAQRDSRISYFRNEENLGVSGNYRRCFELSSGEFFKWAAHDDLSAPELVARCVNALDQHIDAVLAFPRTKLIDENGAFITDYSDNLNLQSELPSERFKQLQRNLKLCNAVFGLVRARTLKKTALIGSYVAADVNLLGELILYGKFWEIPEYLFYRRFHSGASSSMKQAEQLLEYLEPSVAHNMTSGLTEWRRHWDYAQAVRRAPISIAEKLRTGMHVVRMAVWNRQKLKGELSSALLYRRNAPRAR